MKKGIKYVKILSLLIASAFAGMIALKTVSVTADDEENECSHSWKCDSGTDSAIITIKCSNCSTVAETMGIRINSTTGLPEIFDEIITDVLEKREIPTSIVYYAASDNTFQDPGVRITSDGSYKAHAESFVVKVSGSQQSLNAGRNLAFEYKFPECTEHTWAQSQLSYAYNQAFYDIYCTNCRRVAYSFGLKIYNNRKGYTEFFCDSVIDGVITTCTTKDTVVYTYEDSDGSVTIDEKNLESGKTYTASIGNISYDGSLSGSNMQVQYTFTYSPPEHTEGESNFKYDINEAGDTLYSYCNNEVGECKLEEKEEFGRRRVYQTLKLTYDAVNGASLTGNMKCKNEPSFKYAKYNADGEYKDTDWSDEVPSELGKYVVKCDIVIEDFGGINDNSAKMLMTTFQITLPSEVTKAPAAIENLTYTGKAQTLVTAGEAQNGVMQYSLKKDGDYSKALPTAVDADTYIVYYKAVGNENYTDTEPKELEVTISKKTITVTADDVSKQYGELDPEFTYICDGLVEGDTLELNLQREKGESVGEYEISLSDLGTVNNYNIQFTGAKLTITEKNSTVDDDKKDSPDDKNDEKSSAGNYTVDASSAGTEVAVDKKELIAAVGLGQEEEKNGNKIDVNLQVKNMTNEKPDEAKILEKLESIPATTLGAFFDITLEKKVTDADGKSTLTPVTDTNSKIAITITLPDDMKNGSDYRVIRVHKNGNVDEVEILDTKYNSKNQTLTFETNRFSTYAIAYTPKADTTAATQPTTAESTTQATTTTTTTATTQPTTAESTTQATTTTTTTATTQPTTAESTTQATEEQTTEASDDEDEDYSSNDAATITPDTSDRSPFVLLMVVMLLSAAVMMSTSDKRNIQRK